jgi:hypothetical protein
MVKFPLIGSLEFNQADDAPAAFIVITVVPGTIVVNASARLLRYCVSIASIFYGTL